VSFGEPFNQIHQYGNPSLRFMDTPIGGILFRLIRWCNPVLAIRVFVFHSYNHQIHAVGWKLFYRHGLGEKLRRLRKYLQSHKDIHVIHLTRENLLASLVSLRIAQRTGEFIRSHPSRNQKNTAPISLTTEECEEYFRRTQNDQAFYERFFHHHPWLEISYDELWKHKERTLTRVQSFLHVAPLHTLFADTRKQNTKPLRSLVSNYDDLKKFFHKTKWHAFFP
jgi:hypothetical protein